MLRTCVRASAGLVAAALLLAVPFAGCGGTTREGPVTSAPPSSPPGASPGAGAARAVVFTAPG